MLINVDEMLLFSVFTGKDAFDHLLPLGARADVLQQPCPRELGADHTRHQAVAHGDHGLRPKQVLPVLLLRPRDVPERLVRGDARDVALVPLETRQ